MRFNQEILQEKFEKLPPELQEALSSVDYAEKLKKIGEDHRLLLDQLDRLFEETAYSMLGLSDPKDFSKHIEQELRIDSRLANAVARDVNEEIFAPIRTSLMSILEEKPAPEKELGEFRVVPPTPTPTTPITSTATVLPKPTVATTPEIVKTTPANKIELVGRQPIEIKIDIPKQTNLYNNQNKMSESVGGESKEDLLAAIENMPKTEIANTMRAVASAPSPNTNKTFHAQPVTLAERKLQTEQEQAAFSQHLSFPAPKAPTKPQPLASTSARPIDKLQQPVRATTTQTTATAVPSMPSPKVAAERKSDPYREQF